MYTKLSICVLHFNEFRKKKIESNKKSNNTSDLCLENNLLLSHVYCLPQPWLNISRLKSTDFFFFLSHVTWRTDWTQTLWSLHVTMTLTRSWTEAKFLLDSLASVCSRRRHPNNHKKRADEGFYSVRFARHLRRGQFNQIIALCLNTVAQLHSAAARGGSKINTQGITLHRET